MFFACLSFPDIAKHLFMWSKWKKNVDNAEVNWWNSVFHHIFLISLQEEEANLLHCIHLHKNFVFKNYYFLFFCNYFLKSHTHLQIHNYKCLQLYEGGDNIGETFLFIECMINIFCNCWIFTFSNEFNIFVKSDVWKRTIILHMNHVNV